MYIVAFNYGCVMFRFIFNFIIFGFIFYLMGRYMPDTMATLQGWCDGALNQAHEWVGQIADMVKNSSSSS